MTELLLKDQLEFQKRLAERNEWEKLASLQEAISVLKTRFDGALDSIRERLGDAVSDEDLKELKREMEMALRDAMSATQAGYTTANDIQSDNLINRMELMLARDREAAAAEAKRTRHQFQLAILAAVLSILGALFVFYETTR